jgi:hypothetical protein
MGAPMPLPQQEFDKVMEALRAKARAACLGCGANVFDISGFTPVLTVDKLSQIAAAPTKALPAVTVTCTNCGLIHSYSLSYLGVIP